MVYIVSFDEKSPFVYASVFVLFCLLVGFFEGFFYWVGVFSLTKP